MSWKVSEVFNTIKDGLKRALHKLLAYKAEITFPDGETTIVNVYLSEDCVPRAYVWGDKSVYLQSNGIVRGLWPNDKTTWKACK